MLTLESWAEANSTKVLVVTKDGDWISYCEQSKRLVAIDNLGMALGCFQREAASYDCQQLAQQLLAGDQLGISAAVEKAINEQDWKINFIPEADSNFYFETESVESSFKLIEIQGVDEGEGFEPVEYDDDFLVVRMFVEVSAEVTGNFSFQHWDGIDKEYISMGSGSVSTTEETVVEVLVTFTGRIPDKAAIEEVEVLPKSEHVSFGEIEPDWMSDPDNFDE